MTLNCGPGPNGEPTPCRKCDRIRYDMQMTKECVIKRSVNVALVDLMADEELGKLSNVCGT